MQIWEQIFVLLATCTGICFSLGLDNNAMDNTNYNDLKLYIKKVVYHMTPYEDFYKQLKKFENNIEPEIKYLKQGIGRNNDNLDGFINKIEENMKNTDDFMMKIEANMNKTEELLQKTMQTTSYLVNKISSLEQFKEEDVGGDCLHIVDKNDCLLRVNNLCFTFHVEGKTWASAREACQVYCGDLMTEKHFSTLTSFTKEERNAGKNFTTYIWIGALDDDNDNDFKWVNGAELSYLDTRWGGDDPQYGDNDHCLGVRNNKIFDRNCLDMNSYICQIPLNE